MIDFLKADIIGIEPNDLLKTNLLDFYCPTNINTGELIKNELRGDYYGLKFKIKNGKHINLEGSLHKYWNQITIGKSTNYNDYSILNLINTINDICNKFSFIPDNIFLHNLEFGVNLVTPFYPKNFLKNCIINYKGEQKIKTNTFNRKGYLIEFEMSQYYVKLYDKGMQYNLPDNVLRFEIKVMKMEYIKNSGIRTMADLCDKSKLKVLGKILQDDFNHLLICDDLNPTLKMSNRDRQNFNKGVSPLKWEKLKPDSQDFPGGNTDSNYKRQRKRYYKDLTVFNNVLKRYKLDTWQILLSEMIINKWDELLRNDGKIGDKLTDFHYNHLGQINPSYIVSYCPIKRDISFAGINNREYISGEVNKVLKDNYDVYFSDYRILSDAGIKCMTEDLNKVYNLELSQMEFLQYVIQMYPIREIAPF